LTLLTPAEQNEVETQELCHNIKSNFLRVGFLLYENLTHAYWSLCGHHSFSDYLESLGIGSRSQLSRLTYLAACSVTQVLREDDILEMGMSNAIALLPAVRRGNLTQDMVEVAKCGSNRELRAYLGHKLNENDHGYSVTCPHCGFEISGCKWVHKDADIL